MRSFVAVSYLVAALFSIGPTADQQSGQPMSMAPAAGCSDARTGLRWYRARANEFLTMRDHPRWPTGRAALSPSCPFVRWAADLWRRRARAERRAFDVWYTVVYGKWSCIHSREGAWNDSGAPHYGGLQFDDDFQATYGREFLRRWGHAGNWPVWSQLVTAERAYRSRGFYPWPNTARMCGLL